MVEGREEEYNADGKRKSMDDMAIGEAGTLGLF